MKKRKDISIFNTEAFRKLIDSYKKYGSTKLERWLKTLPDLVTTYEKKYLVKEFDVLKNGRLGLLLYGYSNKYKSDIVIKIIPDFLNTFEIEYHAYDNLSKEYMCPLLDVDFDNNALVLKKLDNNRKLEFHNEAQVIRDFFNEVYATAEIYDKEGFDNDYISILINNMIKIKDIDIAIDNRYELEPMVLNIYYKCFSNKEKYLLHGDLHIGNILYDGDKLYAIDPLGYVAPKEFIFARFILVELFYAEEIDNYIDELLEFISKYVDKKLLLLAVLVDSFLFLTAGVIQIDNKEKLIFKDNKMINLIVNKLKEIGVDLKDENSCDNYSEIREQIFGGRELCCVFGETFN